MGKMIAAAVPYKKKSYHSILVPAKDVIATLRMLVAFSRVCTSLTLSPL